MGTKHGYTEKKCSKCGKMKPRSAYRKRGSLMCLPCFNADRRQAEQAERNLRAQQKRALAEYRAKLKKGK